MKLSVASCMFLLFLPLNILQASETVGLSELCSRAALQKDLKSYSDVCNHLYQTEDNPDLLLLYADSIRQVGLRTKNADCFIEHYMWSSEAHFQKSDFAGGYTLKRKAIALAERAKRRLYLVNNCSDIGYYFNVDTRYDSARYYFKKGMAASEDISELAQSYRTMLTNYASSYLLQGETDSALVYTNLAKERSIQDRDTAMLIENLNQLGTLYRRKKNLEASIGNFEEALHLCEVQKNFRTAAFIYGNIATVYCDWERPKEAIPFSEKALEYALKTGNPQMQGVCYVNLGAIQCNIEELRKDGIATLKKAIPLLMEVNNKRRLCEVYGYLSGAYRNLGKLDAATIYLERLEQLSDELQTDVERYRYYRVKADLLQAKMQYREALQYYQRVVGMLDAGYRDARDYEHYASLARCYAAIHDENKAYACYSKAYQLLDSNFHKKYVERLSDYSAKYKTKEKELEITRLRQKELERKTELLHKRVTYGVIIIALVILLLGLLYGRQRQKARLAVLAQAAGEKERQFLALQKETEQRLARKYIDGLESERERMATELHDDVCNNLLALEMNIRTLASGDKAMDKQMGLLEETRERLRNISHELMPPAFQYATVDEMLADYVQHVALQETTRTTYRSTENADWNVVPREVGFEVYRIVQEAVSNAIKYAGASEIKVELKLEDGRLSVVVADDGKGFEVHKKTKGVGLRTIIQRAETIGAEISLNSAPGEGTCIELIVRIEKNNGEESKS